MNFLCYGRQLAAFIVLTAAILTGLMIIAAAVAFLLYKNRSRLSGLPSRPQIRIGKSQKRGAAAELMKEGTPR
jgi:cytochrome bd-type quinol oxidase subunit 1